MFKDIVSMYNIKIKSNINLLGKYYNTGVGSIFKVIFVIQNATHVKAQSPEHLVKHMFRNISLHVGLITITPLMSAFRDFSTDNMHWDLTNSLI